MSDENKEPEVIADPVARRLAKSEAVPERGVPKRLRLDKEGKRKAAELQASLAQSRARLSPDELRLRAARSREMAVFQNLAALWRAHDEATLAHNRTEQARLMEEIGRAANAYAEALAEQGRFKDAAGWAVDPERAREYREYARAVEMPDDERCACPSDTVKVGGSTKSVSPRFTEKKVYSETHGAVVHAVRCNKCSHLNIRPSTGRLAQVESMQAAARRSAEDGGALPHDLPHDSKVLKS